MGQAGKTKAHAISEMLLAEIERSNRLGEAMSAAWDRVFGEGSYDAFVTDLYHSLRAKAVSA
ncbi:MAG TPA: hypothetical protein DDW98_08905 [Gammaproteobacteria bacterium]|jgi:hypothetical protein|nr:hypothetical protein [Gammaproteobacteria bacterium]